MNKKIMIPLVIVLIAVIGVAFLFLRGPSADTPGGAVQAFYYEIERGNLEEAEQYIEGEGLGAFEVDEDVVDRISIDVNILEEDIENGEATVEAEITEELSDLTEEEAELYDAEAGEEHTETIEVVFTLEEQDGEWVILDMMPAGMEEELEDLEDEFDDEFDEGDF